MEFVLLLANFTCALIIGDALWSIEKILVGPGALTTRLYFLVGMSRNYAVPRFPCEKNNGVPTSMGLTPALLSPTMNCNELFNVIECARTYALTLSLLFPIATSTVIVSYSLARKHF